MRLVLCLEVLLVLTLGISLAVSKVWERAAELTTELGRLEAQNAALREENRSLTREVQLLRTDPTALERVARHEFGLVRPDEQVLRLGPVTR